MNTEEKRIEKTCSFYASDYHLEMIMIPYINKKIQENSKVVIITQRNLKDSIKEVMSRVNLQQIKKQEILNITWSNNGNDEKLEEIQKINNDEKLVVFIIGDLEYIKKNNKKVKENIKNNQIKIVDCYSLEEIQENIVEIVSEHNAVLNTTEVKEINEKYC